MKPTLATLILSALASIPCTAATYRVPTDYATIQAAVNAAQQNPDPQGDVIEVSKGVYDGLIVVTGSKITIVGKGRVVIDAQHNLYGVASIGDQVRLRNLRIRNVSFAGISLGQGTDCAILGCEVRDSEKYGIRAVNAVGLRVEKNVIRSAQQDGIRIENTYSSIVAYNDVRDAWQTGIYFDGHHGTIQKNLIKDAGLYGIQLDDLTADPYQMLVVRNTIQNTGNANIRLDGAANRCQVIGNRIKGGTGSGIHTGLSSRYCVLRENVIRNCDGWAFYPNGQGHVIAMNKVSNVFAGVYAVNSQDLQVLDNQFTRLGWHGIKVGQNSAGTVIADNTIKQAKDHSIAIWGDDCSVIRNKVVGGKQHGIHFASTAMNGHATGNSVQGAGGDGFRVDGTMLTIVDNRARSSKGYDLSDSGGTGNVYLDNKFPNIAP